MYIYIEREGERACEREIHGAISSLKHFTYDFLHLCLYQLKPRWDCAFLMCAVEDLCLHIISLSSVTYRD